MSEWQPIETAPRDGTLFLAWGVAYEWSEQIGAMICKWNDEERGPGVSGYTQKPGWVGCCGSKEIDDEGWDTGNGYTLEVRPTHWMPLPKPPKDS